MLDLCQHSVGANLAIGLAGTHEEIENYYLTCFNRGATDQSLNWETDNFAYFRSNPKKFKRGLANIELARICNKLDTALGRDKDPKKDLTNEEPFVPLAQKRAEKLFDSIPKIKFLSKFRGSNHEYRISPVPVT